MVYLPRIPLPHQEKFIGSSTPSIEVQALTYVFGGLMIMLLPLLVTLLYAHILARKGSEAKLGRRIAMFSLIPIVPSTFVGMTLWMGSEMFQDWEGLAALMFIVVWTLGEFIVMPILAGFMGVAIQKARDNNALPVVGKNILRAFLALLILISGYKTAVYSADWRTCGLATGVTLKSQSNEICLAHKALEQNDMSACKDTSGPRHVRMSPDSCIFQLAQLQKSPAMCENIANMEYKNHCLRELEVTGINVVNSVPVDNDYLFTNIQNALAQPEKVINLSLGYLDQAEAPKETGQFPNLKKLSFYRSKIQSLPSEIGQLKNLEYLSLEWSENITEFPPVILELKNLRKLNLYGTQIAALPQNMDRLTLLESLDIGWMPIATLPDSLRKLSNLREIGIQGVTKMTEETVRQLLPGVSVRKSYLF